MNTVYQNFELKNPTTTLAIIIWGLYIGFMIAGAMSIYNKGYLGEVVRALVKAGAHDAETAVFCDELGIRMGYFRRKNVLSGGLLSKYVKIVNPEECIIEKKPLSPLLAGLKKFFFGTSERKTEYDAKRAKIYLLEEKRIRAEIRYSNKGTNFGVFIVSAVVFLACVIGLTFAIPFLLDLLDSAITLYKNLFGANVQ